MRVSRSTGLTQKPGWLFLASSMLTSILVTWPLTRGTENTSLGSPAGDHIKHLWNLWWVRASSTQDPGFPLFTRLVNAPEGLPFWPIEPLHGLAALALPGLALAPLSDLLALTNLVLTGVCTAFLVHALTRSVSAAICAAFLFQVSSFPAFAIEVGVGELQHAWLLPLGALCLWRLWRHPKTSRALVAGGVLGITPLVSFYLGLYAAATATTLTLAWWWFGRGPRPDRKQFGLAAALALLLAMVVVSVFSSTYGPPP